MKRADDLARFLRQCVAQLIVDGEVVAANDELSVPVSSEGAFLGGVIAPGMQASAASLFSRTARLTRVELTAPPSVIGKSTVEAIQSGLIFGTAGEVDAIVTGSGGNWARRTVVATGGLAPVVIPHCTTIDHHEPWLTLEGLRMVFEKNPVGDEVARRRCLRSRRFAEPSTEEERSSREAEVLAARRDSLERLEAAGIAPFALTLESALGVADATPIADIRSSFGVARRRAHASEDVRTVAGRVVQKRDMGKLQFLVLRDRTGDLQLFCNAKGMDPPSLAVLAEVDLGDIVGATGTVGSHEEGRALDLRAAARHAHQEPAAPAGEVARPEGPRPAAAPALPASDRRRDAPPLRQGARRGPQDGAPHAGRAAAIVEFEGPMLQVVAGGANARPFTTYHHVLDQEMKLRISLELYLKRMLVGGLERVYELGRNFRNEGIDRDHNPEFTMLEAYQAYGDYHTMMALSEDLVVGAARAVAPIFGRDPERL